MKELILAKAAKPDFKDNLPSNEELAKEFIQIFTRRYNEENKNDV